MMEEASRSAGSRKSGDEQPAYPAENGPLATAMWRIETAAFPAGPHSRSRQACVAMVQAAQVRQRHDLAPLARLDCSRTGRVASQRQMGPCPMIIDEEGGEGSAQMPLAQHDEVVETVAADGADKALHVRILPGRLGRNQYLFDPQVLDAVPKVLAVDAVAITKKITGRLIIRKRLGHLPGDPDGRRMIGHMKVD